MPVPHRPQKGTKQLTAIALPKYSKPYMLQPIKAPRAHKDSQPAAARIPTHLTVRELAKRFQVSEGTLGNWRVIGEGPRFIKVGSLVRYPIAEIEAWENKQLKSNTSQ